MGLIKADGKSAAINLTQSGFNDSRARWILGGKAMLWFSNRDGLKSVAQSGSAQSDAYAMFFTQDAWDRFRLTKEEYALVKEADEKKEKDKPKDAAKDAKDVKDARRTRRSRTWRSTWTGSRPARPGSPSTRRRSATPS